MVGIRIPCPGSPSGHPAQPAIGTQANTAPLPSSHQSLRENTLLSFCVLQIRVCVLFFPRVHNLTFTHTAKKQTPQAHHHRAHGRCAHSSGRQEGHASRTLRLPEWCGDETGREKEVLRSNGILLDWELLDFATPLRLTQLLDCRVLGFPRAICWCKRGAMTGGYGSQFDPMTLDSDDGSSEGSSDDCILQSFGEAEDCGGDDDDCYIVPSPVKLPVKLPVKVEATNGPSISLTSEQQQVLDFVRAGKNVFFSGSGGTGKTLVLQEILKFFKQRYFHHHNIPYHLGYGCGCFSCNVAVTAPTGIAAIPIGGSTLHRAAGIGIPRRPRDFNRMWEIRIRRKWRNLSVLIIDEISMVSAELLEYLEQMVRKIRDQRTGNREPFGGLQVIFAGDFFQLQPVEDKDTHTCSDQFLNRGLAFEAPAWHRANLQTVILRRVFRQEDDRFVDMLNGIRTGEDTAALEEILVRCSRPLPVANGIVPTVLYARNVEVDKHNNQKLNELPDREVIVHANEEILSKEGLKAEELRDEVLQRVQLNHLKDAEFWKDCLALRQIRLKVGAQVMLLRNLELEGNTDDLVNGSRGILVAWKPKAQCLKECQKFLRSCDTIVRNGFETDLQRAARIRAETKFEKLSSSGIDPIPVVRFRNGRLIDCVPELFSYEILNVGMCIRRQVPLKLAWAITIHKCQGMTLDYVKVTLRDIFAEGQVYVALSRARSMDGLQVIGDCSRKDVRVSRKVVEFYKALAAQEAPSVGEFVFPDLVFDIPAEEVPMGRKVDGRMVYPPGMNNVLSRKEEPFETCPAGVLPDLVHCYYCKETGHPAHACPVLLTLESGPM